LCFKVSQFWSVTAAHCIDANPYTSRVGLLVGDWDTTTGSDTKWAKVYSIASFIKHPSYNVNGNVNDVALVKTNNYIKFK
jgi:secreted trypsin-like serine protease